jgi:hypothetical protein
MNSYKDAIRESIKEQINVWVQELKQKHPELLLTSQWDVVFKNGFVPGHVSLPVVCSSKEGKHQVATVEFIVPENLEVDLSDLRIELVDLPYVGRKSLVKETPSLTTHLDTVNDLIIGVNKFLSGLLGNTPGAKQQPFVPGSIKPISVVQPKTSGSISTQSVNYSELQNDLKHRGPEWFRLILDENVREELSKKIVEAYGEYLGKGNTATWSEFLSMYESFLVQNGRLKPHCNYKGKKIDLDEAGFCLESYCSKKPYKSKCDYSGLKFGK